MKKIVLIRYGEIHLKGQNRPFFERALVNSIKDQMKQYGATVERTQGRYYLRDFQESDYSEIREKLRKIFGIHSFSPAYETDKDMESISEMVRTVAKEQIELLGKDDLTFKVDCKRADKRFPMNSMALAAELGGVVLDAYPDLKVNIHDPDFTIFVEIREHALIYSEKVMGSQGMPKGTSGKALLLLSGGIDSPVAGYMMAKRGLSLQAIHYHSFPYTSERAKEKVISLAKEMAQYMGPIKIHMIHFTDIQMTIYEKCPEEQLTILMRVFMMKIAEKVAKDNSLSALVTGESLAQVASQTLDSLAVTNSAVDLPVFRPLIGMDKLEIIDIANRIGTYETSILPYEDCCTVFVPKHPVTHPRKEKIFKSLKLLDVDALIEDALSKSETITVEP